MKRRLFNLVAAVSLVLCVATAALGVASYSRNDWFSCSRSNGDWFFANMRGQLRLGHTMPTDDGGKSLPFKLPPYRWEHWSDHSYPTERVPGSKIYLWGHGFGVVTGERWQAYHHELLFPHWCAASLFAAMPLVWCCKRVKRRRPDPLHCACCGYDLRASFGYCPECGYRR